MFALTGVDRDDRKLDGREDGVIVAGDNGKRKRDESRGAGRLDVSTPRHHYVLRMRKACGAFSTRTDSMSKVFRVSWYIFLWAISVKSSSSIDWISTTDVGAISFDDERHTDYKTGRYETFLVIVVGAWNPTAAAVQSDLLQCRPHPKP